MQYNLILKRVRVTTFAMDKQ